MSKAKNTSEQMLNNTANDSDCITLEFGDFVPWNNPDNIVSLEQEELVCMLRDLVFLPVLFLIGCPGNLINMAVFFKQGLKERINVCLFALSLSDEMYLIYNMMLYGDQIQRRFTTKEKFGPMFQILTNLNLLGFYGFIWISQILTAIIATDRCFCILQPLRYKNLLRTSTLTVVIVGIFVVVISLVSFIATRYRTACAFDPVSGTIISILTPGEFYIHNSQFVDYLDAFVFGSALPGFVTAVTMITTVITAIKLRQAARWRAGTSSISGVTQKEIGLTKMLVANSIFFMICVIPFFIGRAAVLFKPEINVGRRHHNFHSMIVWLLTIVNYFNCSFNVIIYYTMGSRYRQTFWDIFSTFTKKRTER